MESDSNSDSDGSHISATPPRNHPIPPPRHHSPIRPKPKQSTHSNSSSIPKPKPQPKPKPKPKSDQPKPSFSSDQSNTAGTDPKPEPSCIDQTPAEDLPFQIRPPLSDLSRGITAVGLAMETLPAGFFSRTVSFSRSRRTSLSFDAAPASEGDPGVYDSPAAEWLPEELKEEDSVGFGGSAKSVKRLSNLIGGNVTMPPVKLRKCGGGGEGNFVKLNLKRNGKKFLNKRGQTNASNRRRPYKRFTKKPRGEGRADDNRYESVCGENDSVTEMISQEKQKQNHEGKKSKLDPESIQEALLAARNDPSSDENLIGLLRLTHGYDSFREGQLETIKMVLSGRSSMLVLPTGAGKSLCYQFPAMILPGVTLVVSPLVALMIDQLKQLPPIIRGGLFCSNQTAQEVAETVKLLKEGAIKVLFVSPERFLNTDFVSIFNSTVFISLVVVDEAHCISEWSHNFRPSYMRLRASLLKEKLNVKCILAMTATVTTTALHACMSALEIPQTNLIQKAQLRENFELSVSLSKNRTKDLLVLIKSSPFTEVQSIIVYCKFQYETDIISRYLCDYGISAKSYHSGLQSKDRSRVQELFCSNKVRVVVATVAFGMGLDKKDVGAVIHYSLPESLEEYVQEIGRAGRDGRSSYCHLFLDDETYFKLRSLMFSDGVDQYTVDKFLSQVFSNDKKSQGKICSIVKESASHKLDVKEEVMFTLLTQLELGEVQFLRLLPQMNVTCSLSFHKTPCDVLAEKNIVISEILKKSEVKQGEYVFDIPTVANGIGISTTDLSNQLQILKIKGEITYELKDQAYCYTVVEVPKDLCSLSADLTKWLSEIESCKVVMAVQTSLVNQVQKLDTMFNAAQFAVNSCEKSHGCSGTHHTPCLQRKILNYFNEKEDDNDLPNKIGRSSPFLRADIKVFLQSNSQAKFTPRAVARIMHGIASPAYSSAMWSKTHFWGRYTSIDFHVVMEAAKAELINFTNKDSI